ncbi:MAG: preprotein translocase subunit SecE [Gammaproteobacteria bacterium]
MADKIKLLLAIVLLAGGVGGFYYYANQSTAIRVLGLLVVVAIAIAITLQTQPGRDAWEFLREARNEIRKVVWPTRKETMQTTLIVFIVVILVAIILWLLDMFLLWAVQLLTNPGA